jgi:hypothetical protein
MKAAAYILALTCLYLDAFVFPHTPVYEGDTSPIYLLEATKMLHGQVIYRDFFQFTFPGTQIFYMILFKILGARAWIPSAVWVALGIGLAWTCLAISRQVLSGAKVYLPSLVFLGVSFFSEPDPNHHWFSMLACMVALAVLIPQRSPSRWAAAGALCGVATLFTHSRGIVAIAGFAAYMLWEWRTKKRSRNWLMKTAMCLLLPFLGVTAPVAAYFAWKVGPKLFFNCTVVFLAKYWSKWFWGTPYVYGADVPTDLPLGIEVGALLMWIFIHLLLPMVYIIFFFQYRRRDAGNRDEPWDRLVLLAIVGVSLFLGIVTSPVWFRLISVSPPALIIYFWTIRGDGKISRFLSGFAWAGGMLALLVQPIVLQTGWKGYLDTPTGRTALFDPNRYEKYRWILQHTHAGDYFFQADDCNEYFLLGLRNPARVSFVTDSAYTRPDQVQNAVEMLERHHVQWVMWSAWLDIVRSPGADGSAERPLRNYLRSHYHPVKDFADQFEEAWERNSTETASDGHGPAATAEKSQARP